MDSKLKTIALWAGLGAGVTVSSILFYLLLRQEEEYEVKRRKTETTDHVVIKVTVPRAAVGGVIGRQGGNIKQLQEKTSTKINFDRPAAAEECDRVCTIRGTPSDVKVAEELMKQCIEEQMSVITETVFVPGKACGRIIGRNGDTIRGMCRVSGAKILVDRIGNERDNTNLKSVSITGTKEQIKMAISMIDEKLAEEQAFQEKMASASAGKAALYRTRPMAIKGGPEQLDKDSTAAVDYIQEELVATSADGFIEVYISSMDDPSSFHVQMIGTHSVTLDKLVADMTNYYSHPPNQKAHALTSATVGDLVAARFYQDDSWYRTRVHAVVESDYSDNETLYRVHYVDFGEIGTFKLSELCSLREEYNYLPLQAMECSLAGVRPRDGEWTEAACDRFDDLTHASQWRVMMAKVVSKTPREDGFPGFKYSVELVDTNNREDVNVAAVMISEGFAVQAI